MGGFKRTVHGQAEISEGLFSDESNTNSIALLLSFIIKHYQALKNEMHTLDTKTSQFEGRIIFIDL